VKRPKLIEKGDHSVRLQQPKSHQVGVQVSFGVHPEVSPQSALRQSSPISGNGISRVGKATGERNCRGPLLSRPCAYADSDSPEVFGVAGSRAHQGEERNPNGPGLHQCFKGYHFWSRGYLVSTVGIDEATIRDYICNQEENDQKDDQNRLF
jgi:hypothetical protein